MIKIYNTSQTKELDNQLCSLLSMSELELMEYASERLFRELVSHVDKTKRVIIVSGTGNNGGDGLVLARLLNNVAYDVEIFLLKSDSYSDSNKINQKRLIDKELRINYILDKNDFPAISRNDIVVDAMFGAGLNRPAEGVAADLIRHINDKSSFTISVDIPSGMHGEKEWTKGSAIIKSSLALTLEFPKMSFFHAEHEEYLKDWKCVRLSDADNELNMPCGAYLYDGVQAEKDKQIRSRFAYKNTFGHLLFVGGSYGMMGAAVLATKAALRSGVGLVSAHIPICGVDIMQISVPEAIVRADENDVCCTSLEFSEKYSAIAVGCGIGSNERTDGLIAQILNDCNAPLLIDADALNIIARNKWLNKIPKDSVITPHLGEFQRLFGEIENSYEALCLAKEQVEKLGITIVMKGAYTKVVSPDGLISVNTTGNCGMATAGSGDVLSGIIGSLLAQGYEAPTAARLGVWLHGRAGGLAAKTHGMAAMIASDIVESVGKAYKVLEMRR
ncbi:MAG: NAD(P)H-hydrate dehydratase [Bacteroidales bacterium]